MKFTEKAVGDILECFIIIWEDFKVIYWKYQWNGKF